jgi:hypothetical protein
MKYVEGAGWGSGHLYQSLSSSASLPARRRRLLQNTAPVVVGPARSSVPVRVPLLSATSATPMLHTAAVHPSSAVPGLPQILWFVPAVMGLPWILLFSLRLRTFSSERSLASSLVVDVQSRRWEISLGKRPVEEVADAAVGGNFFFLFCLAFSFFFRYNIIVCTLVMFLADCTSTLYAG